MGQAGETACPTTAGTRFRKVAQAVPPAFLDIFTASQPGARPKIGPVKSLFNRPIDLIRNHLSSISHSGHDWPVKRNMKVESRPLCGRDHILVGNQVGNPPLGGVGLCVGWPRCGTGKAECHSAAGCHPAPQKVSGLAYQFAQMPAVLRLNRAGLHFHVAHPSNRATGSS